jgi:branched-chain amino acid aminotransferase
LQVELTKTRREKVALEELQFGHTFTDHMLTCEWTREQGWETPLIRPYGNLSLPPSASVLHYAIECFEGLKAYKDRSGAVRLFRPELNMKRLLNSAQRLALPSFDPTELLALVKEMVKTDIDWIPDQPGYSLYIRPTIIGTQESLGVSPPNKAMLFVICCPVGPYYKTGFSPVSLYAEDRFVRAWPGGTGAFKIGAYTRDDC